MSENTHPAATHCDGRTATADEIDLLPMPNPEAVGMYQAWSYDQMQAYARANVEHHTTALQAEIEALRAELERLWDEGGWAVRWAPGSAYWSEVLVKLFGPDARRGIDALEARWRKEIERAERLEEALRQIAEWPDGGNRYGQENIKRFAQAAIDAACGSG